MEEFENEALPVSQVKRRKCLRMIYDVSEATEGFGNEL